MFLSNKNGDNSYAMVLSDDGNLGINSGAPTSKLHVSGDAKIDLDVTVSSNFVYVSTKYLTDTTVTRGDDEEPPRVHSSRVLVAI